jgi:hypothetical protein
VSEWTGFSFFRSIGVFFTNTTMKHALVVNGRYEYSVNYQKKILHIDISGYRSLIKIKVLRNVTLQFGRYQRFEKTVVSIFRVASRGSKTFLSVDIYLTKQRLRIPKRFTSNAVLRPHKEVSWIDPFHISLKLLHFPPILPSVVYC